eukprot:9492582-Pyramimonas_sp.AAC.1
MLSANLPRIATRACATCALLAPLPALALASATTSPPLRRLRRLGPLLHVALACPSRAVGQSPLRLGGPRLLRPLWHAAARRRAEGSCPQWRAREFQEYVGDAAQGPRGARAEALQSSRIQGTPGIEARRAAREHGPGPPRSALSDKIERGASAP